jgi:hypothetical protein
MLPIKKANKSSPRRMTTMVKMISPTKVLTDQV